MTIWPSLEVPRLEELTELPLLEGVDLQAVRPEGEVREATPLLHRPHQRRARAVLVKRRLVAFKFEAEMKPVLVRVGQGDGPNLMTMCTQPEDIEWPNLRDTSQLLPLDPAADKARALEQFQESERALFGVSSRDVSSERGTITKDYLSEDESYPSENESMTMLAPFFKQRIGDALEVLLGPVASVLQKVERKQREGLLALEEMKLALRRKKIQCLKRRRAGRFRRTSSLKASRPRTRHCHRPKFPPAM